MQLWLERYILPICATIVFGIIILNPFKFDWPQRLSLLVAISAFAYFVAHTIHKPKPSPVSAAPDPRISFLERQIESLQEQQRQLAEHQQATAEEKKVAAEEKRRRQVIRDKLGLFLKEAGEIRNNIAYNNPASLTDKQMWERRVEEYLAKNLGDSYTTRFRNPSHQVLATPLGIDSQMRGAWADLGARMAMLNDFISELRD